jgi:NADH-quinone oxidoreductase subunit L
VIAGYFVGPVVFGDFFGSAVPPTEGEFHGVWAFMLHGVVSLPFWLAVAGIATAYFLYMKRPDLPKRIAMKFGPLYALVERKYGFDELYAWLFAGGARVVGKGFWRGGDQTLIDGLMVNGSARVVGWFSGVVRLLQSGLVNQYAVGMLIGVAILTFWFMRK